MQITFSKFIHKHWLYLAIICIAFLVYLPSFGNTFIWDDEQFIYKNAYVLNFDLPAIFTTSTTAGASVHSDYYRPLTTTSFAIDNAVWGLKPFGFHLSNTVLHALAGITLFAVLNRIGLNKPSLSFKKISLPLSAILAIIFVIHPLQTESVVYINSRGDSFYVWLGMLSLLSLVTTPAKAKHISNNGWDMYLHPFYNITLTTCFYLLAILAKEIGITILGLAYWVVIWQYFGLHTKFRNLKNQVLSLVTMSITAALYLYARATVLNFGGSFESSFSNSSYSNSLWVRLMTFMNTCFTYLRLMILPHPLHMERETPIIENWMHWSVLIFIFISLIIVSKLVYELWHKKMSLVTFGAGWFMIGLIPVSGIIPVNGLIYEHWLYLPLVGFFVFLIGILNDFSRLKWAPRLNSKVIFFIFLGWSCLLIAKSWHQVYIWRNPISLYNHVLKFTKTARVHNNLAMAYSDQKDFDLAIEHYTKSIKISSVYPEPHYNLARQYFQIDQPQKAIEELDKALEISPTFFYAHIQKIQYAVATKNKEKAQEWLEDAKTDLESSPILIEIEKLVDRL